MLNTRVFKYGANHLVITVGSISKMGTKKQQKHEAYTYDLNFGEFAPYLEECNYYLTEALKYVANETQAKMIEFYIEHFKTGNIETHKDSQRQWVKDMGPVVESNLGWIETYVDPANVRAYWEGWVAIVNKE